MRWSILSSLLLAAQCSPLWAQAIATGRQSETRWLFESAIGSEAGLGFRLPHVALGIGFERPIRNQFELQGSISYSPDRKYITNDGNSVLARGAAIYWATEKLGLMGSVHCSRLWTSQFTKGGCWPVPGVVVRSDYFGPSRIYMDYVIPTGCQWGPNCMIQSSRTQGPEFEMEARMWPHFRLGFHIGVYRILEESNPLKPEIPRTAVWTGDAFATFKFEFPAGQMTGYY
jgi:hypothetical protein